MNEESQSTEPVPEPETDTKEGLENARQRIFNESPPFSLNEKTFGQPLEKEGEEE